MIKRMMAIILLIALGGIVASLVNYNDQGPMTEAGRHVAENGLNDLGGSNLVTSVIASYRGLDTLGEVTVLFMATAAIGFVLRRSNAGNSKRSQAYRPCSELLCTGARILSPLMVLFGIFIILHGHLTPGGGFQGGVILASAFLLMIISRQESEINEHTKHGFESLSGLFYVLIAVAGLLLTGHFLNTRFLPTGQVGALISAGAIPLISVAIGLKVGAEMVTIIDNLREDEV